MFHLIRMLLRVLCLYLSFSEYFCLLVFVDALKHMLTNLMKSFISLASFIKVECGSRASLGSAWAFGKEADHGGNGGTGGYWASTAE